MASACDITEVPPQMNEVERQRAVQANKIYCRACEENGVKGCSWENFSAWREYVDGEISEAQLTERASQELKQFSETFRKYAVVPDGDHVGTQDEARKKERARNANRIYRTACTDSGMSPCFFSDFGSWSEYVRGDMDDDELRSRALKEARAKIEQASGSEE